MSATGTRILHGVLRYMLTQRLVVYFIRFPKFQFYFVCKAPREVPGVPSSGRCRIRKRHLCCCYHAALLAPQLLILSSLVCT